VKESKQLLETTLLDEMKKEYHQKIAEMEEEMEGLKTGGLKRSRTTVGDSSKHDEVLKEKISSL